VELKVDKEGYLNVDDADVRRAYLKISQKIHPDKLPAFTDATRSIRPSFARVHSPATSHCLLSKEDRCCLYQCSFLNPT